MNVISNPLAFPAKGTSTNLNILLYDTLFRVEASSIAVLIRNDTPQSATKYLACI